LYHVRVIAHNRASPAPTWPPSGDLARTTTHPDARTFAEGYRTMGRYRLVVEDASIPAQKRRRLAGLVEELAEQVLAREGVLRSAGLMGAFLCREPI
jgi:hypothetical protein